MVVPLMPKATAVWLVDHTTLTFQQIAEFVGMHVLEINGIADGEVAVGIKGIDPIAARQLGQDEIKRCEADPEARLQLHPEALAVAEERPKATRFTPRAVRQARPDAIAWILKYHPELPTSQVCKLVGTTKPTVEAIRSRTHWNQRNLRPTDPVGLGLCTQAELDAAVEKAMRRKKRADLPRALTQEEKRDLMRGEQTLASETEPLRPGKAFAGLENFRLHGEGSKEGASLTAEADTQFNLPPTPRDDPEI